MMLLLRTLLSLIGLAIIWLGLNVGFGGIKTLGWQGARDFLEITDAKTFAVQDNHIRFIAGIWTSVGLLFIVGAFNLAQMRTVLITLIAMIFMGGLMRFTQGDIGLLTGGTIVPSLIAELILFPILGLWVFKVTKGGSNV